MLQALFGDLVLLLHVLPLILMLAEKFLFFYANLPFFSSLILGVYKTILFHTASFETLSLFSSLILMVRMRLLFNTPTTGQAPYHTILKGTRAALHSGTKIQEDPRRSKDQGPRAKLQGPSVIAAIVHLSSVPGECSENMYRTL